MAEPSNQVAVLFTELVPAFNDHAVCHKLRKEMILEEPIGAPRDALGFACNDVQLFGRRRTTVFRCALSLRRQVLQSPDPGHEVDVETTCRDAQQAHACQKGDRVVLAVFDETILEGETRELRVGPDVHDSGPPIPSGTYSAAAISSDHRASSSATRSAGSASFFKRRSASKCATPFALAGSTIRHSLARRPRTFSTAWRAASRSYVLTTSMP